jgi:tungstate transport system ATP-binding protein
VLPLKLRRLSLEAGGRRLIDSVDLKVEEPGITVILGPNGAGKSLLLRLAHGLVVPTEGTILWGGRPMDDEIRRRQAMVFQKPVLLRRTSAANITYALGLRGFARSERNSRAQQA